MFISQSPSRIIVRMPNWLGDLVMATPILTDLRHYFPEAKITAMATHPLASLLEKDEDIDELFSFSKPRGFNRREAKKQIIEKIRQGHYDLGILLTNSFSSAWWFWRGDVKERLGYSAHYRHLLLNHPVPFPKNRESQHLVLTYKMLLQELGIPLSQTKPRLYISPEEKEEATARLRSCGVSASSIVLGINPTAAFGPAKCWPPDRFRELTVQLLKHPNLYLVYFGDHSSIPLIQSICKEMPDRVVNLTGQTSLRELIALIQQCDLFLTNDSGPMHVAAALNVPLVALFGSTNDTTTGPYLSGRVIHKHVECSPCYKRECPIDFRCMKRISVEEVYNELKKLIANLA